MAITMKLLVLVVGILVVVSAHDQAWEDYKLEYNKQYSVHDEPKR